MTETKMQLVDWLDDLCVRFIVNLPKEELESVERICFQVEEAQWFYEDFIRPLDPNLPSLNLRQFCLRIFQHCPLLSGFSPYHHSTAFSEFLAYKTRVPVRGAIMLNEAMDEVVLVKGWKKNANWSFPRGKINKDEKDLGCAIREVYEETGFDIHAANLVANEEDVKYIEVTMREQHMRLYVFRGVPIDTNFEPRTRKEISKIQWYKLSELPTLKKMRQQQQEGRGDDLVVNANKFYMVAPFLVPLKKWISQQKKLDALSYPRDATTAMQSNARAQPIENSNANVAVHQPSPVNDMSRLMTQLRQSGKSVTTNDVAELSGPDSPKYASAHLKTLLHVPQTAPHEKQTVGKSPTSGDSKANAMLALLRSGTASDSKTPSQTSQTPRTALEPILGPAQTPRSSQVRFGVPFPIPDLDIPSSFPFSPDQVGKPLVDKSKHSTGGIGSGPGPLTYPASNQPIGIMPHTSHLSPYTVPQQSLHPLAPYQRTGDPQFAEGPRHLENMAPSIPPANALPPPKLTSHSSALLNIFRTGNLSVPSSNVPPAAPPSPSPETKAYPRQSVNQTQSPAATSLFPARRSTSNPPQMKQTPAFPPVQDTADTIIALKPRSQQQEALLSLFRIPSMPAVSKAHTSSPSLAPPTTIVELSAQPSPSHSRVSSEVKKELTETQLLNGHVTIQKRPEMVPKPGQAPVSATVTGPLHFPQFDKILKRVPENSTKRTESIDLTPGHAARHKARPVSILARPVIEEKPSVAMQISQSILPKEMLRQQVSVAPSTPNEVTKTKEPNKSFQPQILRRPTDTQPDTILHPLKGPEPDLVSAAPPPILAKNTVTLDRRASQTQVQKNALLSLFNKTQSFVSPLTSVLTSKQNSLVSPISERSIRAETEIPSPLDRSRSRIGSLTSIVEGGIADGSAGGSESGRQTPKAASPVDKQFLLGFLDGVVKRGK